MAINCIHTMFVQWQPRGIGSNWNIPDIETGIVDDVLKTDLSGFVSSKAEAHIAMALFDGNAFLDFRPYEPQWIQVKVSGRKEVLVALDTLVRNNGCILTKEIVLKALRTPIKVEPDAKL